jgi:uncharacterized membrane protein required for colicin V production
MDAVMEWFKALNWVDWAFFVAVLYGAALGAKRGLSHELGVLIGMLAALVATRAGYDALANRLAEAFGWNPLVARLAAVVALVLGTMAAMWLLRKALGSLMDFHFKGLAERLGGLLTGAVRQAAVFSVVLLALYFVQWNWLQRAIRYDSLVGRNLVPLLVEGYNAVAERAAMIQAEVPTGVRLVMPPAEEPAEGDGGEGDGGAYPLPPLVDGEE